MFRKFLTPAAALLAAATTTFSAFSSVAGLADEDRALRLAAKQPTTLVVGHITPVTR
jgi:hypothetical protein